MEALTFNFRWVGLVGSKSIGIALPHVCFSHLVLHFVCHGLLRNRELFWKISSSTLHARKHVLSPLQELQVIRIYQYPWKAILRNALLYLCARVTQQINSNPKVASNMEIDHPEWIATHLCTRQQSRLITLQ